MSDVERLLHDYIAEHRAGGEADPLAYLERVDGADRAELAELLDAYLERAPGRDWDPAAYRGSAAERLVESLDRSLRGQAGLWPSLLPRLRERARVRRADLVARLAAELGVGGREEKVAAYYHEMEQGQLASARVSGRVLEVLGGILGTSAETLRKAGEALGPAGPTPSESAVFARMARPSAEYQDEVESTVSDRAEEERVEWDEVDELFRGG
jgi:hypothetical protein